VSVRPRQNNYCHINVPYIFTHPLLFIFRYHWRPLYVCCGIGTSLKGLSLALRSPPWLGLPLLWNICVINDHGYVPLVVNTSRSFPRSWLITGFVTRLTRRVSLVEQELPTLPEHLSSPHVFSGVRVTRSLDLYVCFVHRCFSFCTFFFWPFCCLFFFDIRILIAPLVSSNSYF